jgi:hypothetical protein
VGGAMVRLTCGPIELNIISGPDGTFGIPVADRRDCTLIIRRDGFEEYRRELGARRSGLVARLALAGLSTQVDVVATDPAMFRSLGSLTFDGTFLRLFGGDVEAAIAYAQRRAGAAFERSAIQIDGLPAELLPSATLISSITIDDDPFSSEYGDGDLHQMEIFTRPPDRRWSFAVAAIPVTSGGQSPLAPDFASRFRRIRVDSGGPAGALPLTFSAALHALADDHPQPVRAIGPDGVAVGAATATIRTLAGSGAMHYARRSGRATLLIQTRAITRRHVIADALTLPEAAVDTAFLALDVRGMYEQRGRSLVHRGGFFRSGNTTSLAGSSSSAAVQVAGMFTGGGSSIASAHDERSRWLFKHVSEDLNRRWLAGFSATGARGTVTTARNPFGSYQFESLHAFQMAKNGAALATLLWSNGPHSVTASNHAISAFAQRSTASTPNGVVRAGLRLDYQAREGISLSPRVNATWRAPRVRAAFGAGAFTSEWSLDELIAPIRARGDGAPSFVPNASYSPGVTPGAPAMRIQTAPDSDLQPRHVVAMRAMFERAIGSAAVAVEHSWIRGSHLLGWRRLPDARGWLDVFDSDRRRNRHQLHFNLRAGYAAARIGANYLFVNSIDDTDGLWSFAAHHDNLSAERAPSTGVARHNVNVTADFDGPGHLKTAIIGSWSSAPPLDIVTGRDPDANGLFLDRPSDRRNAGYGPTFSSLDAYAHLPLALDRLLHRKLILDLSIQAENLRGTRNAIAVNNVQGSPSFGQALSAFPGRTLRFSIAMRR